MSKPWTETAHCKVHLDMHCPDWSDEILSRFDAAAIVDQVADAGADALYFFGKDCYGNAYYPTAIGKPHPALQGRDFLREVLAAAAERQLPIVVYYSVIWDNYAAERHPQWRMRGPRQQELSDTVTSELGKWRYLCHNTGYADYAAAMIGEIARGYDVAGFHLDMFNCDFGGLSCYCAACQAAFRERTGSDLPLTASWDALWREFLQFRYDSVERLMLRLRDAARAQNRELPVVMNYHGAFGFDWRVGQLPVRHSLPSSMATGETYTPMFGDLYPGMEGRFVRGIAGERPFEMVSWRMNRITDFTVKGLPQLRWEVLTALLHGGSTMLIDQPFHDGTLDQAAYGRIKEVFQEANRLLPGFQGDFVPHVGLYYSAKTRDWYARSAQERFVLPIMGAYKALVESHFQVDFVFDELVSAAVLAEFPVLLLADVAILSDSEIDLLRRYVERGGKLLATYNTSRFDLDGHPLADFALADVLGVSFLAAVDCDNCYYELGEMSASSARPPGPQYPVLCQGEALQVNATTATPLGALREAFYKRSVPQRFFSHNIHPPYRVIGPAAFRNEYGQGECVYVPFGLDRSYADLYELPEHRETLGKLVGSLAGPPLLDVDAPGNCEVVLRRDDRTLWVHLTMFNPLRQSVALPSLNRPIRPSIRMERPAIYEATLHLKQPFVSAKAIRPDTTLRISGDKIEIVCRDVHEAVAIVLQDEPRPGPGEQ